MSTPAAIAGHVGFLRLFHELGVDLHLPAVAVRGTRRGRTPLQLAATNGRAEACALLIEHGADVEPVGMAQNRPLWLVVVNGDVDTVRVLLKAGADVRKVDVGLRIVLHRAVFRQRPTTELVTLLIAAGARETQRDRQDESAFDLAKRRPLPGEILDLLRFD